MALVPRLEATIVKSLRRFSSAVRADYRAVQGAAAKYNGKELSDRRLPIDAVQRIGFQMMIVIRTMRLARDLHLPLIPQLISRIIRHLYAAEIHWNTDIAEGVSLVHGTGLVLSHSARIGERCILFQGVTLGESIDPVTRMVGAPTLENDVHVGPGAVLLGPITVGSGSKIMANVVLTASVPPKSVVRAPDPEVVTR